MKQGYRRHRRVYGEIVAGLVAAARLTKERCGSLSRGSITIAWVTTRGERAYAIQAAARPSSPSTTELQQALAAAAGVTHVSRNGDSIHWWEAPVLPKAQSLKAGDRRHYNAIHPDRVLVSDDGHTVSPSQVNGLPLVIFVRRDGWTLAAPRHLVQEALALWRDDWTAVWVHRGGVTYELHPITDGILTKFEVAA